MALGAPAAGDILAGNRVTRRPHRPLPYFGHCWGLWVGNVDINLSLAIACVLLAVYALNLCFQLITHKRLFAGEKSEAEEAPRWSLRNALFVLCGSTALVAWMSEILVGAIEPTTRELGLNSVFVVVFVIAILGNAAEHATAVRAAMNNRMDLSLSIAIGSSVQIALFVAPVLVMLSYFVGPQPMDLMFRPGLVFFVFFTVLSHRSGGWRWRVRLAEGRSAAGSLHHPWPFHLLRAHPRSTRLSCHGGLSRTAARSSLVSPPLPES